VRWGEVRSSNGKVSKREMTHQWQAATNTCLWLTDTYLREMRERRWERGDDRQSRAQGGEREASIAATTNANGLVWRDEWRWAVDGAWWVAAYGSESCMQVEDNDEEEEEEEEEGKQLKWRVDDMEETWKTWGDQKGNDISHHWQRDAWERERDCTMRGESMHVTHTQPLQGGGA
jgi:hypothetical protein